MTKFKFITSLAAMTAAVWFTGCHEGKKEIHATSAESAKPAAVLIKTDSEQVVTNIIEFLKWYSVNYKKAGDYAILIKDNSGSFTVDSAAYVAYLGMLQGSGLVSKRYLDYWRVYFNDKEAQLEKDRIKTGTPEGFDFDYVLITQTPGRVLDQVEKIKYNIISISDSAALVGLTIPHEKSSEYEFEMYKEKDGWKIGYILTPNYD